MFQDLIPSECFPWNQVHEFGLTEKEKQNLFWIILDVSVQQEEGFIS